MNTQKLRDLLKEKEKIQNNCELELQMKSNEEGNIFFGYAFEIFKKYLDIKEKQALEVIENERKDEIEFLCKYLDSIEAGIKIPNQKMIENRINALQKQQLSNQSQQKYAPEKSDAMREMKYSRSETAVIGKPVNASEEQTADIQTQGCRINLASYIFSLINPPVVIKCGDIIWNETIGIKRRLYCNFYDTYKGECSKKPLQSKRGVTKWKI